MLELVKYLDDQNLRHMVNEIFALVSEKKPAIVECVVNPLTEKVMQVDSQLVHQTSVVFGNYGITGEVRRVCISSRGGSILYHLRCISLVPQRTRFTFSDIWLNFKVGCAVCFRIYEM